MTTQSECINKIIESVAIGQSKGSFTLQQSNTFFECISVLTGKKVQDAPTPNDAVNLLLQGAVLAQEKGSYTLEQASSLYKSIVFLQKASPQTSTESVPESVELKTTEFASDVPMSKIVEL